MGSSDGVGSPVCGSGDGDHGGDPGGVLQNSGDCGWLGRARFGGVGVGSWDSGVSPPCGGSRLGVLKKAAALSGTHARWARGAGVSAPCSRSGRTMRWPTRDMAVRVVVTDKQLP